MNDPSLSGFADDGPGVLAVVEVKVSVRVRAAGLKVSSSADMLKAVAHADKGRRTQRRDGAHM